MHYCVYFVNGLWSRHQVLREISSGKQNLPSSFSSSKCEVLLFTRKSSDSARVPPQFTAATAETSDSLQPGFPSELYKKKKKASSLQHIALHNEKLWFIFLFFMLYSYSAPSNMILQKCQKLIPSFLCMWLSVGLSNIRSSKSFFMCLLTSVMLAFITVKALVYRY